MSHFNDKAAEWDNEGKIKMMGKLAEKTISALQLKGPLSVMDFGCGTGLFGLEFADYASSLLGVDTSEGMLEVFDQKTKGQDRFRSKLINLEQQNLNEKFDLIVSSMAFHHLNHPDQMILKMKTLLNPKGRLAIVDLDKEDGTFHPNNSEMGVKHFGFGKEELEAWAREAGMKFSHQIINQVEKNDRNYGQFLAIFTKD